LGSGGIAPPILTLTVYADMWTVSFSDSFISEVRAADATLFLLEIEDILSRPQPVSFT
jgi:hypothetical protein